MHRRKKPLPEKFQRKQTRVKVKIRSISAERCRYHFWTRCPEVEKYKKYQKADASGQNVQKSEGAEAGEKSKSDFMQPDSTFTEEAGEEQGRKIASDDYRHRDTYHSSQKRAGIKGGR